MITLSQNVGNTFGIRWPYAIHTLAIRQLYASWMLNTLLNRPTYAKMSVYVADTLQIRCRYVADTLQIRHTLRSKGAKWHLLGFFGLSLYWHPQKVLQRTLLGGSLERTLLRTLIWGSLKEPCRVLLNHKLGATKNHFGVLYSTMWY